MEFLPLELVELVVWAAVLAPFWASEHVSRNGCRVSLLMDRLAANFHLSLVSRVSNTHPGTVRREPLREFSNQGEFYRAPVETEVGLWGVAILALVLGVLIPTDQSISGGFLRRN